jgi:hypothetical protein
VEITPPQDHKWLELNHLRHPGLSLTANIRMVTLYGPLPHPTLFPRLDAYGQKALPVQWEFCLNDGSCALKWSGLHKPALIAFWPTYKSGEETNEADCFSPTTFVCMPRNRPSGLGQLGKLYLYGNRHWHWESFVRAGRKRTSRLRRAQR